MSGIWHSRYVYYSDSRQEHLADEHHLVLHHEGAALFGRSVPDATGSALALELSVEGMVVNGYWWERTSPAGHYGGATYHGTLQLLLGPTGRGLVGKWVGFGKDLDVNPGDWELKQVGPSTVSTGDETLPQVAAHGNGRRLSR